MNRRLPPEKQLNVEVENPTEPSTCVASVRVYPHRPGDAADTTTKANRWMAITVAEGTAEEEVGEDTMMEIDRIRWEEDLAEEECLDSEEEVVVGILAEAIRVTEEAMTIIYRTEMDRCRWTVAVTSLTTHDWNSWVRFHP